ncbi:hypothetical protein Cni_G02735 [Canna indica]|uniref:Uncharacterized protein n=1 Tax=Canna indica TaxID=4628 RepID=A0AAQ3JRD0_9LILI|nr:hypothetical protein Cni_G02735 [Canna indica]
MTPFDAPPSSPKPVVYSGGPLMASLSEFQSSPPLKNSSAVSMDGLSGSGDSRPTSSFVAKKGEVSPVPITLSAGGPATPSKPVSWAKILKNSNPKKGSNGKIVGIILVVRANWKDGRARTFDGLVDSMEEGEIGGELNVVFSSQAGNFNSARSSRINTKTKDIWSLLGSKLNLDFFIRNDWCSGSWLMQDSNSSRNSCSSAIVANTLWFL